MTGQLKINVKNFKLGIYIGRIYILFIIGIYTRVTTDNRCIGTFVKIVYNLYIVACGY